MNDPIEGEREADNKLMCVDVFNSFWLRAKTMQFALNFDADAAFGTKPKRLYRIETLFSRCFFLMVRCILR